MNVHEDPDVFMREGRVHNGGDHDHDHGLGIWDAGDDNESIPPRGWLLGNVFCRQFISMLLADGAVGKTALRIAQLLALASDRAISGEHVFQRCRVLIVSLEDSRDELRRRIRAAMKHHGVARSDVKGWLFLSAPGMHAGKLAAANEGKLAPGSLAALLEREIVDRRIDVVCIDPFIKAHGVDENSNTMMDEVMQILADLAIRLDIAVDIPHHTSKGTADPGNANRGRGAGAQKDAGRLVYTLSPMSAAEAETFDIPEAERRRFIRMDSGKVNIAPAVEAEWFHLIGVPLDNATDMYPTGDVIQTVEPWTPPKTWADMSCELLNRILDEIDTGMSDGERFTDAPKTSDRSAWCIVRKHTDKTEQQAREIIKTWLKNGVLVHQTYYSKRSRKDVKGLRVEAAKRPG